MKYLLLAIALFLTLSVFADQTATTEDGKTVILKDNGTWVYDKSKTEQKSNEFADAEKILVNKCTKDFPNDFSTRKYCIDQQKAALSKLRAGKPNDVPGKEFNIIKEKCTKDFPDDFSTRLYCQEQQIEAWKALQK